MATYAVGDIQGCQRSIEALLEVLRFDPDADRLWLTGDLVNRGPRSLEVLRWAFRNRSRIVSVIGNHDLHCLARAHGIAPARLLDTLDDLLAAPDRGPLLEWLLHLPFLHRERGYLLVHAGLLPAWTHDVAESLAQEAADRLRADPAGSLRAFVETELPFAWKPDLDPRSRLQAAFLAFTRLRHCTADSVICPNQEMVPRADPACLPWFRLRTAAESETVLFGHWSKLGLRREAGAWCLDSGCVWGQRLTAVRLEDEAVFSVPCADSHTSNQ